MRTISPVFIGSLALLIGCAVILLACGFFASIELVGIVAPKAVGGLFIFSVGMLIGIYVDKDGLRRPTRAEMSRKLPVMAGGAIMTLLAIAWLGQVDELRLQLARYEAACKTARSPFFDEKVAEAQREAADSQAIINRIRVVRHPKTAGYPCAN